MGKDKAFVTLDGCTLLERALHLAQTITERVAIVGAASTFRQYAPVVEDVFPNCGPLGGIHAALQSSTSEVNLILAVDVPFVTTELLRYLFAQASGDNSSMVIVPRTQDRWQPLCAFYRGEFANIAESALRAGNYKIDSLFTGIKVHKIEEAELATQGFSSQIFRNLNTREELAAAGRLPAVATN